MDGCKWCDEAVKLLENKGQNFKKIVGYGVPEVQAYLDKKLPGHETWPKIFRGDKFIGGYGDLEKLI
jgi:glutaredoxin